MRRLLIGSVWAMLLLTIACSEANAPALQSAACVADDDCDPSQQCMAGECVLDEMEDVGQPDAAQPQPDAGLDDVPEEDVEPEPEIGDPCDEGDDCPSGFCIEVPGSSIRVCTDFCDPNGADCPEGFVCAAVANSGADRVFLCFPERELLCQECASDSDCGGLSDLCLDYVDGNFCGRSCEVQACPEGFDCVVSEGPDGPIKQCRSDSGLCSSCFDPDEDGYGQGEECLGEDCRPNEGDIYPDAPELCNDIDDDCDELIDEDFDFLSDPTNCSECGLVCDFEGASALCVDGQCSLGECIETRHDIDGDPDNGCEYFCEASNEGVELCNGADEDCDALFDEGFDLITDVLNCGRCGRACAFDNAVPACALGECAIAQCDDFHYDINGELQDGCEYLCLVNNEGVEACDSLDNDCDGGVDEDFDFLNDATHCGECSNECDLPNSAPLCVEGQCALGACDENFDHCNDDIEDGCETDLLTDVDHCGRCDNLCDPDNADGVCDGGDCKIDRCDLGFADCDTLDESGCESFLSTDVNNCGACDNACAFDNARADCADSECVMGECLDGFVDLNEDSSDGCEYQCTFVRADDVPDLEGVDEDCDGIDGNTDEAIFVRTNGDDLNDGLSDGSPVATLGRALEIAAGREDRRQILMATGNYTTNSALSLISGKSIYGGYAANYRTRTGGRATLTASSNTALVANNLSSAVTIEKLNITVTTRSVSSAPAIAVTVNGSGSHLTFRQSDIVAGRGGTGNSGNGGGDGGNGNTGSNASGSNAGGGASIGGGNGGAGRRRNSGLSGSNGNLIGDGCGRGGGGNSSGLGCNDGNPGAGGNGQRGCGGSNGGNGARGNSTGTLSGVSWSRSNGTNGTNGTNGGGGGGGGAGGGEDCSPLGCTLGFCGTGRGGGGGGGGGTRGLLGTAGQGGGASIGILIRTSNVTFDDSDVTTIGGGAGGNGGSGGSGGGGGGGGAGANASNNREGDGGNGGAGGNGGNGGCGGGGGGGPSVAIWGNGSADAVNIGSSTFTAGGGGGGGSSCANAGQDGIRSNTRSVTVTSR